MKLELFFFIISIIILCSSAEVCLSDDEYDELLNYESDRKYKSQGECMKQAKELLCNRYCIYSQACIDSKNCNSLEVLWDFEMQDKGRRKRSFVSSKRVRRSAGVNCMPKSTYDKFISDQKKIDKSIKETCNKFQFLMCDMICSYGTCPAGYCHMYKEIIEAFNVAVKMADAE